MKSSVAGISGLRVVIAEDEMLCAMDLEHHLQELECRVVDVISNVDGVTAAVGDAEVALLDVNLKGANSYAVAEAVRQTGVHVIFVTGYTDLPDCPPHLADVPILHKPFTRDALQTLLADAARRVQ